MLARSALVALAALPSLAAAQSDGIRLFEQRRFADAASALRSETAVHPRDPSPPFYLGRIAYLQRDPEHAAEWLEKAVRLDGRSSRAHQWLGRAYSGQLERASNIKRFFLAKKAKAEFETAVALDSNNVEARTDLVRFLLRAPGIVGGNVARGRAEAEAVRKRNPYFGHLAMGAVYTRGGHSDAAEQEYLAAVREFPDSVAPYYQLGYLYQQGERCDDAFRILDQLLRVRPDELGADFEIGRTAAFCERELDRAAEALARYIRAGPDVGVRPLAAAHYWLGVIREATKDTSAARESYRTAVQLDPDLEDARKALRKLR